MRKKIIKYCFSPFAQVNLTIRASLAPRLKLFLSQGPHVPAEGFVTIFPHLFAGAREKRLIGR